MTPQAPAVQQRLRRHWVLTRRVTVALLLLWLFTSFVLVWHAHELRVGFFGWPLGFWIAAQGAPLLYGAIVALYAGVMSRLDRRHGMAEEP